MAVPILIFTDCHYIWDPNINDDVLNARSTFLYNPLTRAVEENMEYNPSECVYGGIPVTQLIDSYPSSGETRNVYSDGIGGLSYILYSSSFVEETGDIQIFASATDGPVSFLWSDGSTLQSRSGLTPGLYTVAISDPQGRTVSMDFLVGNLLTVLAAVTGDSITLTVSGGAAPYTFLWADGPTTQNRTGVSAGQYQVRVTDARGVFVDVLVTIASLDFFFSKNPIALRLQANDLENKPNLSFVCEVWVEQEYLSEVFERVGVPLEQPADRDGSTVFNVQEVLDAYLKPFFPAFGQNYVSLSTGSFKRFYLQHTERFGETPANSLFTQINQSYVVLGGLSDEEYQTGYFPIFLNSEKPFFTWDPPQKSVFDDQPEYLFFLPLANGSFQVRVHITYTDGSLRTEIPFVLENALRHELYCLPTGYAQLGLAALDPDKMVRSWSIAVLDGDGDVVSENRTYTLETDFYQHRRYFLYLNSIGGVNTLACTGAARKNLDTEALQIDRPLGLSYDPGLGDVQVSKKYGKPVLSVSSGYKTRQYMEALQDFEISPMVRLVGKDRYVPGMVATRKAPVLDEMKTLNSLSFDFVLPKMYRYTPSL